MNIKLSNGFEIIEIPFSFRLIRHQIKINKETKLKEMGIVTKGEYSTLEGVFNGYLSHNIHCSEVNDISELKELVKETRKEICENYSIGSKILKEWKKE